MFGRDPGLLALAADAGVPMPNKPDSNQPESNGSTISFIENKIYDFSRLNDLLSVSISLNHHANGGPMVKLLERMIAKVANLPRHRKVIAVSSGTTALHLAALFETKEIKGRKLRWVISSFGFFSSHIGPLANSIVIDCDLSGRFDLDRLKEVPDSEYDGVIYTNIFGVGEGGFIICDEANEGEVRSLTNFGCGSNDDRRVSSSNFKMSDLSAAGIIDRLEKMTTWLPLYFSQEQRLTAVLENSGLRVHKFRGQTSPVSPRSHTAFVCDHNFTPSQEDSYFTIRKYYVPLGTSNVASHELINAKNIYDKIFSLSNAPEMFKVSDDQIVQRLNDLTKNYRA